MSPRAAAAHPKRYGPPGTRRPCRETRGHSFDVPCPLRALSVMKVTKPTPVRLRLSVGRPPGRCSPTPLETRAPNSVATYARRPRIKFRFDLNPNTRRSRAFLHTTQHGRVRCPIRCNHLVGRQRRVRGQHGLFVQDIVDGQVKNQDIAANAVGNGKIAGRLGPRRRHQRRLTHRRRHQGVITRPGAQRQHTARRVVGNIWHGAAHDRRRPLINTGTLCFIPGGWAAVRDQCRSMCRPVTPTP